MWWVDDLISYFSQFGEVLSGSVVYNHVNHKSRGFGFIVFKEQSSIINVFSVPEHTIMDRKVEVKRAIPKEMNEFSRNKQEIFSEMSPEFPREFSREFSREFPSQFMFRVGTLSNIHSRTLWIR